MVLAKEDGFACCWVEGEIQMLGRVIFLFFFFMHPYFLAVLLPWEQWRAGLRLLSPQGSAPGGHLRDGVPHSTPNIMDPSWGMDGTRGWSSPGVSQPHLFCPETALVSLGLSGLEGTREEQIPLLPWSLLKQPLCFSR